MKTIKYIYWLLGTCLFLAVLLTGCEPDETFETICSGEVEICGGNFEACTDDGENYYYTYSGRKYSCDGYSCYDAAERLADDICAGSGSGSSSGSGSGTSNGQISFYHTKDHGCGSTSITVTSNGTKSLTQYFTSGSPSSCGESGTTTWSLGPGTYSYTATCGNSSWNDNFTISSGGCIRYHLQ